MRGCSARCSSVSGCWPPDSCHVQESVRVDFHRKQRRAREKILHASIRAGQQVCIATTLRAAVFQQCPRAVLLTEVQMQSLFSKHPSTLDQVSLMTTTVTNLQHVISTRLEHYGVTPAPDIWGGTTISRDTPKNGVQYRFHSRLCGLLSDFAREK